MKIKTVTTETREQEVNIKLPAFWKYGTDTGYVKYIAIPNDETAIRLAFITDDYIALTHTTPERLKDEIGEAYKDYELCQEQEFMQAYSDAFESIRLRPELKQSF